MSEPTRAHAIERPLPIGGTINGSADDRRGVARSAVEAAAEAPQGVAGTSAGASTTRLCALSVALVVGLCGVGSSVFSRGQPIANAAQAETPSPGGLRVHARSATPTYGDPASFSLEVVFENVGGGPIGVLPSLIRRRYPALGGGTATYLPFPGPRISPWRGAFGLRPGERRSVHLVGMRDGDGLWVLEPGAYALSVTYVVSADLAGPSVPDEVRQALGDAGIWVGELESRPMTVVVEPRATK